MKKILLAFLLLPLFTMAQTVVSADGMKFDHEHSWSEILAKAKAENKYIFMDCFTTWCGPCKYMSTTIFPMKEVGDFYNDKYIMVKVQFDTTANDDAHVKSWFKDMEAINAKYKIMAYPTYLFFAPDGEAVHRAVGSSDAKTFLAKGKDAMDPSKQYYTQLKQYENGKKDPAFLRTLAMVADDAYDKANATKISKEYLATQTDLLTKENLEFILQFTSTPADPGFKTLMENQEKMIALLGKDKVNNKMHNIIYNDMWASMRKINVDPATVVPDYSAIVETALKKYPSLYAADIKDFAAQQAKSFVLSKSIVPGIRKINADKATVIPDYTALVEEAVNKYPAYAADIKDYADKQKIAFFLNKKEWTGFKEAMAAYISKNGEDKLAPAELNSYAWTVFENCKDMTCVIEALEWSKKSFKDKQNPAFIDTYANILHKLGRTAEAIKWEEKAVSLAEAGEKKTYQDTIEKMKKGEKTWPDTE
jgi:thioredoxin-related protein